MRQNGTWGFSSVYAVELSSALWSIIEGVLAGQGADTPADVGIASLKYGRAWEGMKASV
jgi:hypothetical protein